MIILGVALTIIVSYLLGSISSSVIISKALFNKDIRESGSHNAGATNMLRVHGKKMGVITLVLDLLKGVIAVLLGRLFAYMFANTGEVYILNALPAISAFFATVGHDFPVFFGFKGGKGVATSLGALLALNPIAGLIAIVIGVAVIAYTKYVSLGSIIGGVVFIIESFMMLNNFLFSDINFLQFLFSVLLSLLLIIRHHQNIYRLIHNCENKISL